MRETIVNFVCLSSLSEIPVTAGSVFLSINKDQARDGRVEGRVMEEGSDGGGRSGREGGREAEGREGKGREGMGWRP